MAAAHQNSQLAGLGLARVPYRIPPRDQSYVPARAQGAVTDRCLGETGTRAVPPLRAPGQGRRPIETAALPGARPSVGAVEEIPR